MHYIRIDFNKFLTRLIFIFAVLLIISQIIVLTFSKINDDNIDAMANECFKSVKIAFILEKTPNHNIYVLQNGEETAILKQGRNEVNILDNSVIEIDSLEEKKENSVQIIYDKRKLQTKLIDKANLKTNIKMIGRVLIK